MSKPRFQLTTRPDGGWAVDVPDAARAPAAAEPEPPDADVSRWYAGVRPTLEPHLGNPAALGAVARLLEDELDDLVADAQRPGRIAQIAVVRGELQRFVAALRDSPSAFEWQAHSTGGLDIDPLTGKTLYVGGQAGGHAFFPDGE